MNVRSPEITVSEITKTYGEKTVLNNLSLTFPAEKTTALMGPSGCGKTTLIKILCGLEKPDKGTVGGISQNNFSVVFQEDRLFPNLTLFENVNLPVSELLKEKEIIDLLEKLELSGKETLSKYPSELSGGMKRRAAIARALIYNKPILILDEAIKGLDKAIAKRTLEVIAEHSKNKTVITVTHNHDESDLFAQNIITL